MVAKNSNIISLEDFDESINMLIYGNSGVGKTVFAGSANKVLFLAVEQGTVSAKRQGSKADVWPINSWKDLDQAYLWLYDNPDHGYQWVVLDSITQMQQMALQAILTNAVKENASRDPDIPAIQDHFKWQQMFKRFTLAFCSLPVNVLFTSLVRQADDEEGDPFLTPDIAGKGYQISQYVCAQTSCYGYMRIKRKEVNGKVVRVRQIVWQDTGKIRGKDRYGVLAPMTTNKTLQEVTDMINSTTPKAKAAKPTATSRQSQKVSTT